MTRYEDIAKGLGNVGTSAASTGATVAGSLLTGGIAAGVGIGAQLITGWIASKQRSGQQKIQATALVNELERELRRNKDEYLAGPRTRERQLAYAQQYQLGEAWLTSLEGCGNPDLGKAGQRCIEERVGDGVRFPWREWYLKPITDDPDVVEDAKVVKRDVRRDIEMTQLGMSLLPAMGIGIGILLVLLLGIGRD